ncbi:MAG: GNAT family N-acetyltransferase [Gemmatimonadota bacterium]
MDLELREAGAEDLVGHAALSIAFEVDRVLALAPGGGPRDLVERDLPDPWIKDYDAEEGASPSSWPVRFDTSSWRILSAWHGQERAGGVVLIAGDPGIDMLEDRSDLALIWDLRVAPAFRGRGVGGALLRAALDWARSRGCRELKVETQTINVAAFRFYERQGFELRAVNPGAYATLPDEIQLLLYRPIA